MATYSGNPNNYPIALTIVDDSSPPNATNFNTPVEGLADQAASLQERGSLAPALTLQPPVTTSSFTTLSNASGPYAVAYDDTPLGTDPTAGQKWLLLLRDNAGANTQVFAGYADGEDNWVQVGGNVTYNTAPTSLCVDSAGNIYFGTTGTSSGTVADVFKCAPGGSFTSAAAPGITPGTCTDNQVTAVGTNVYFALGSSSSLGSIWKVGTGSALLSSLSVGAWIGRSSPSMALFVPAQAMATPVVYKVVGSTLTSASIGLATTDVPQDLAWSAVWSQWVLVAKTSGGASTIWTSPDGGATWTLAKTLSALPTPIAGLCAFGPHLIGTLDAPSFGNRGRVVTSSDGGLTWYAAATGIVTNSGSSPISNRPVAAPNQIFFGQTKGHTTTGQPNMRFSALTGRGDTSLS